MFRSQVGWEWGHPHGDRVLRRRYGMWNSWRVDGGNKIRSVKKLILKMLKNNINVIKMKNKVR